MSDDRLDRIEEKVDKLADAMVEMARMEERLITVFKRMDDMGGMLKKMDDRLDEMERQAIVRGQKIAFCGAYFLDDCNGGRGPRICVFEMTKQLTEKQQALIDALGERRRVIFVVRWILLAIVVDAVALNHQPYQEEIIDSATTLLAMNAHKAALGLVGIIDDPSALGLEMLYAAKEVLDRAGVVRREQLDVKASGDAVFILPPKNVDQA